MKETPEKSNNKLKMLAVLVQFLEMEIKKKDLLSHPEKINQYKQLLWENLWGGGAYGTYDTQWKFRLDQMDIEEFEVMADENPRLWSDDAVRSKEVVRIGVNTILYHHRLLKSVWEKCKEKVQIFNEIRSTGEGMSEAMAQGKDLSDYENWWEMEEEAIENQKRDPIDIPGSIHFNYQTGKFYSEGALIAFGNLLENISADDLRVCKNETCKRWFVVTSKHKREYCSPTCAKNNAEMNQRRKDPEKYNKYHREYYHKNISKKKVEEETGPI